MIDAGMLISPEMREEKIRAEKLMRARKAVDREMDLYLAVATSRKPWRSKARAAREQEIIRRREAVYQALINESRVVLQVYGQQDEVQGLVAELKESIRSEEAKESDG